jgi:hypothetical protein
VSNTPKALDTFIMLAWIPAGFLGLFIAEKLPNNVRLPFYILLIVGLIYYRAAGSQKLRKKLMNRPEH